jgi:hypothetical protein
VPSGIQFLGLAKRPLPVGRPFSCLGPQLEPNFRHVWSRLGLPVDLGPVSSPALPKNGNLEIRRRRFLRSQTRFQAYPGNRGACGRQNSASRNVAEAGHANHPLQGPTDVRTPVTSRRANRQSSRQILTQKRQRPPTLNLCFNGSDQRGVDSSPWCQMTCFRLHNVN